MNSEMLKLLESLGTDPNLLLRVISAMYPEDGGPVQQKWLNFSALFAGVNVTSFHRPVKPEEVAKMLNNGASIFAVAYTTGDSLEQYVKDVCSELKTYPVYRGLLILETIIGFALAPILSTNASTVSIEVLLRVAKIRDLLTSFSCIFGDCDMEAFKLVAGAISDEPVAKLLFGKIIKDDEFRFLKGFQPVLELIVEIYAKKEFRRLNPGDMHVLASKFFT